MVSQEIGHSSVVMTEKYAKFNLRKLRDDFPSLKERINLRLTPPSEDKYFTTLLNVICSYKWDTSSIQSFNSTKVGGHTPFDRGG